jgi:hypothetical protein
LYKIREKGGYNLVTSLAIFADKKKSTAKTQKIAMSQKLQQLIRNVRACKTAADERGVIAKESALIRTAFKEENDELVLSLSLSRTFFFSLNNAFMSNIYILMINTLYFIYQQF